MSEVPQIGLPNLVSQGDLVARARAAAVGAERAGNDEIAHELQRIADRRREQVQETERVDALARERRERGEQGDAADAMTILRAWYSSLVVVTTKWLSPPWMDSTRSY